MSTEETHQARLIEAVQTGDVESLVALASGAYGTTLKYVRDYDGRSLVQIAVRADKPGVLDVLLEAGCCGDEGGDHVEVPRGQWRSPLCAAVELGHFDCVRVLLSHGVPLDSRSLADGTHHMPLHVAAMFDATAGGLHDFLVSSTGGVDARDACENSPLHLAAAYGSYEVALAVIDAGADVNAVNASGSTPLHLASPNGYTLIVELLLARGADVNAQDVLGNTPLIDAAFVTQSAMDHFACGDAQSQSSVIKLLLASGADVDACNRDGNPAVSGAVRNGYTDAVLDLLDRGAKVSRRNRREENVLHVAARAGVENAEIWKRLLLAGADVLARDRFDRTCYGIWISRPKVVPEERPERDQSNGKAEDDPVARLLEAAIIMRL